MSLQARLCLLLVLGGCDGLVEVTTGVGPATPMRPSAPPSTTPGLPLPLPTIPGDPQPMGCSTPSCDLPVASSRAARLTHAQWENTARDLLRLPALPGLSSHFTPDPTGSTTFDTDASGLRVSSNLFTDYQQAAEALAVQAVGTPALLTALLPSPWPADPAARATAFVKSFGLRAFRRPLTADEVTSYAALFSSGAQLTAESDPVKAGVRITVQAMLQSPFFLYRLESSELVIAGQVPLSSYEVATRLSYALLDSMPDEALLAAASTGALVAPEVVVAQAERLWSSGAGASRSDRFHASLFDFARIDTVKKDPAVFPGLPATLPASMRADTERTVRNLLVDNRGGLKTLLTSAVAFVNADTAPLYGVAGTFGSTPQRVELDATKRGGLFTRLGFLAAYSYATDVDSIHRGAFLNRRLLCAKLPPPPGNVPPLPPTTGGTNRQRVEAHTGKGTCGAGCHGTFINPAGFAFEGFDAVGKARTMDNGFPIDAKDSYLMGDGSQLAFDGATDFQAKVANAEQTHDCYVGNWLQFLHGRPLDARDAAVIQRLGRQSLGQQIAVHDLVISLVSSPSFLNRPQEVTP